MSWTRDDYFVGKLSISTTTTGHKVITNNLTVCKATAKAYDEYTFQVRCLPQCPGHFAAARSSTSAHSQHVPLSASAVMISYFSQVRSCASDAAF